MCVCVCLYYTYLCDIECHAVVTVDSYRYLSFVCDSRLVLIVDTDIE